MVENVMFVRPLAGTILGREKEKKSSSLSLFFVGVGISPVKL
jgi:hypothetical protein